jgi:DNA-binding NtrC family response regulator
MPQFKTSASHRVLLVDDDEAVREMMGMTLESKGFDVTSADSVTAPKTRSDNGFRDNSSGCRS